MTDAITAGDRQAAEVRLTTKDYAYIGDMRQRLGLGPDDTSKDDYIAKMTPMNRLKLLVGWHLGDPAWAISFIDWAQDVGLEISGM